MSTDVERVFWWQLGSAGATFLVVSVIAAMAGSTWATVIGCGAAVVASAVPPAVVLLREARQSGDSATEKSST